MTYLNKATPTLGNNGELGLVFDDANAYQYLSENKADCQNHLKKVIEDKIGKEIEISVRKNECEKRAADVYPDLRDLIQFDIEEENFEEE